MAETPSGRGQQALLTEERADCDDLNFTSDHELEPSSPTRLLRNIEKQVSCVPGMLPFKRCWKYSW